MNGIMLAFCVRDRWPPIHIIMVSGHALDLDDLPLDVWFFRKPYNEQQVAATMVSLLS